MLEVYGPPLAPPVEYTRWTLARMGIPYRFEPAAAGISAFRSWLNKVPIELPLILVDGQPHGSFRQAFALLHDVLNATAPNPQAKPDPAFAEDLFSHLFSPGVRCFYATMLSTPQMLKPLATHGVPMLHRLIIKGAYPLWRSVMTKGLMLDTTDRAADKATMDAMFARVAERLGNASFLGGAAPGADDFLFAACASPVILPPGHPVTLPPVDTLPDPLRSTITAYRQTAAGQLALETYHCREARD